MSERSAAVTMREFILIPAPARLERPITRDGRLSPFFWSRQGYLVISVSLPPQMPYLTISYHGVNA
jgi:hypothetical protein